MVVLWWKEFRSDPRSRDYFFHSSSKEFPRQVCHRPLDRRYLIGVRVFDAPEARLRAMSTFNCTPPKLQCKSRNKERHIAKAFINTSPISRNRKSGSVGTRMLPICYYTMDVYSSRPSRGKRPRSQIWRDTQHGAKNK